MPAGPQSSISGSGRVAVDRPDDRPSLIDCPDECAALVKALSDGRPHAIDALSFAVLGSLEGRDRIIDALDALQASGMALHHDRQSVSADAFEPLDAARIRPALPGWHVDIVGSIDSTNSALLQIVRDASGEHGPVLLACELQRAGRGRLGRRWRSAPGSSLTMSVALFVDRPLAALASVTLVCGLAVRDALATRGVVAWLKWPNDLVVDDRKLAGILVEAHGVRDGAVVVIGIGLNVGPRLAAGPTTGLTPIDLVACGATSIDRNRIAADIGKALAGRLATFERAGFAPFTEAWNAADAFRGRSVVLRTAASSTADAAGLARGVDDRGALLLEVDGRVVRIVNGDLSLRPEAD